MPEYKALNRWLKCRVSLTRFRQSGISAAETLRTWFTAQIPTLYYSAVNRSGVSDSLLPE